MPLLELKNIYDANLSIFSNHCSVFGRDSPHLVSQQIVFVIDVGVRVCLWKQLLDKLHFLRVLTDVTLKKTPH